MEVTLLECARVRRELVEELIVSADVDMGVCIKHVREIKSMKSILVGLISYVISKARKSSMHGPPPPIEIRARLIVEEGEDFNQSVYKFCDKLFKFFGWCIAVSISIILWESTKFGLFIATTSVMFLALFAYVISNSFCLVLYIFAKLSRSIVNPAVILLTLLIPSIAVATVIPKVFLAGMNRLIRAQTCSIFHKESTNIPERCRKFVR